jgi:protein-tyrosine phosphatase
MRAKVFWISGPWHGRLGILPRPRGGDWLTDETTAWREAGVDVVVSLLEPEEEAQLVLEGEAAAAAASGIDFRPFPIPDRGVPASRESVAELANSIVDALDEGKNVAVHCRQGIGRSGIIAGGVLVAAGQDVTTALKAISDARGIEVPETEEQRRWFRDFATWLDSIHAVRDASGADERRGAGRSGSNHG